MNSLPLVLLLTALSVPSPATAERVPGAGVPVQTVEELQDALVAVADERDGLREALEAATAEIARLRAAYDAQTATLAECEADLTRTFDLNAALLASHRALDDLLTKERKAAARQRWMDRLGCTVGIGVSGWDDAAGGASVTCGVRLAP